MPQEHPKIRGDTHEEKFASIEQILKSLSRKLSSRGVIYVPPVPLFMHCDLMLPNSVIGKVIVPFSGTIRDIFIRAEEIHTKVVNIGLKVIGNNTEAMVHFTISKKSERLLVEMQVEAGSVLQLILEEGSLADALVTTAIYPYIDSHQVVLQLQEILGKENGDAIQTEEKQRRNI
jgi:hypothetical protein